MPSLLCLNLQLALKFIDTEQFQRQVSVTLVEASIDCQVTLCLTILFFSIFYRLRDLKQLGEFNV